METRANYAIIGLFTIAVIVAAFGFVLWFSGSESSTKRQPVRIVFNGSVSGLVKGGGVLFNGIRVGDVTTVYFNKNQPQQAFATIEVDRDTPIRTDTQASLDVALLSGNAVVSLRGDRSDAPPLTAKPGEDMPTIVAQGSGLSSVLEQAKGTAAKAEQLLDALRGVVNDNRESLTASIRNVQAFSEALGRNAPSIDRALASIGGAAEKIGPLAERLQELAVDTDKIVKSVQPRQIASIVDNTAGLMQTISDNRAKINDTLVDLSTIMRRLNDTVPKLDATLAGAANVLSGVDPAKLSQTIDNASRFTAALAAGSRDTEQTLKNANSLTAKLNSAADKIDGLVKAGQDFLGSAAGQEGKDTFSSIRDAMERFGRASDNLNRQATIIGNGVSRFTSGGSRAVEGVAVDARRTVNDVGQAARNLDRNPSSIIFGSGRPPLPEYNGR